MLLSNMGDLDVLLELDDLKSAVSSLKDDLQRLTYMVEKLFSLHYSKLPPKADLPSEYWCHKSV